MTESNSGEIPDPFDRGHFDEMEQLVARIRSSQSGSPSKLGEDDSAPHRNDVDSDEYETTSSAINPTLRWGLLGGLSSLVAYIVLLFTLISGRNARGIRDITPMGIVGVFVWGTVFACVGLVVGMIVQGLWAFVRMLVNRPVRKSYQPSRSNNTIAADPFAERFAHRDRQEATLRRYLNDTLLEPTLVHPDDIEVVDEDSVETDAGNVARAEQSYASIGNGLYLRWAVLGAIAALGVFATLVVAVVTERNGQVKGGWSTDDMVGAIFVGCVFGAIAILLGAVGGVVVRSVWEATGLANAAARRQQSVTNNSASDPFADRFADQGRRDL